MSQQQPQQSQPNQPPHHQPLQPPQLQPRPQQPPYGHTIQHFQYSTAASHGPYIRPAAQFTPYYYTNAPFPPQYAPVQSFMTPQSANYANPPLSAAPTGQQVTGTQQPGKTARERKVASIKDPKTNQEVDLRSSLSTKSSTPTTRATTTTNNATTNANTNSKVSSTNSNDNSTSSPSVSNILLQKVSEGFIDSNKDQIPTNNREAKSMAIIKEPVQATPKQQKMEPEAAIVVEESKPVAEPISKSSPTLELKPEPELTDKVETQEVTTTDDVSKTHSNNETISETIQAEPITSKQDDDSAPTSEASIPDKKAINDDVEEDKKDIAKTDDDSEVKKNEESDSGNALHYQPGQYNPISNRTGRKVYSKQFLLDVCEKVFQRSVFDVLQNLDDKEDPFTPNYAQNIRLRQTNTSSGRQSQPNYMGRNSAGQEGRQRKVIPPSSSLTQEVELKTVANPWRATKEVKDEASNDVAEVEALKKKFRSILNKLTPDNFDNLSSSVTELKIDTEEKLGQVIDIIFAKALSEPSYCILYGRMCDHLEKTTRGNLFGKTLLYRCQCQFLSDVYAGLKLDERQRKIDEEQDADAKKHLQDELYEDMYRCRMRGLGLIKFIGELYKIGMLNDKIMFECINRLLIDTSEESIECLCDLLATIGEKLDQSSQAEGKEEKKAQKASKANAYQGGQKSAAAVVASGAAEPKPEPVLTTLDPVFEQLHKIRKNKDLPISLRIRFKLLDVCELREKENWRSKKTKDNNPKKLEEIRIAHQEKLDAERRQNAMGPRRSQEGRRGLGHSSGSSNQISSGGIRNATNMHTSSSSHSIRDYSVGDNTKSDSHNEHIDYQRSYKAISSIITAAQANKSPVNDLRPIITRSGFPFSSLSSGGSLRPYREVKTAVATTPSTNSTATNVGPSASTTASTTTNNA